MFRKYIFPSLIFLSLFVLYVHNLSRSVYGGDVGDLVTAAVVGGVPHPPGYPLFTFLGYILTRFSFWPSPAFAVGLISAFSGSLGAVLFFLISKKITRQILPSLIATGVLSFSYFFWIYSEIPEVFILNTSLALLLFYIALLYHESPTHKKLFLFFFVLGLSFTNQQTIVLALPSLLLLLFPNKFSLSSLLRRIKKKEVRIKRNTLYFILYTLFSFLLGFSIYIYVPIASSFHPVINWDSVDDIPSFVHLLLRQDYGTFNAGAFQSTLLIQKIISVKIYLFAVFSQITFPSVLLIFLGIIKVWQTNKKLVIALLLAFFISGPLFIFYSGFPLVGTFTLGVFERFFILSISLLLLFVAPGIILFCDIIIGLIETRIPVIVFQSVFLLIPCMLFFYNFPKTDFSHLYAGDYLGKDLLLPLPKNAVVFLSGDTPVFNSWYIQHALHIREDITIINYNQLSRDPYFLSVLHTYEKTHPKLSEASVATYIVPEIVKTRPVFAAEPIQISGSSEKIIWEPYGLLFQYISESKKKTEESFTTQTLRIWNQLHIPYTESEAAKNLTIAEFPDIYAQEMVLTASYYQHIYNDSSTAMQWYTKALQLDPNYAKVHDALGIHYLNDLKDCQSAANEFETSLQEDGEDQLIYFLLFTTYTDCLKNPTAASRIAQEFYNTFGGSLVTQYREFITGNAKGKK